MHSVWVGEHHFNEFGTNSAPHVVLAHILAKTERVRVMPGVVVLPLHHPLLVAEDWATMDLLSGGRVDFAVGRGFDKHEYDRMQVDFDRNAEMFAEGIEILTRAWNEEGRWEFHGEFYDFENVEIVPKTVQDPMPFYIACFSKNTMEMTCRYGYGMSIAPFAAGLSFGGVDKQIKAYRQGCEANGHAAGPVNASYFLHLADTAAEEQEARERQIRFFRENAAPAMKTAKEGNNKSYEYWHSWADKVSSLQPEDLKPGSVLLGMPQQIIDSIGKIESEGVGEIGLYVNVGNKDPQQTKDEMQRFMEEVAPQFDGPHKDILNAVE
jgi:alkanesulfonate monooxygenase SsuD/methylene tetrahydromethanopterin reductase-like flavin-dependent oxidoreductase (luciferase family)